MMNSDINDECVENAVEEFVGAGLSDGSSSKAHPLLLDVVLDKVFEYVDLEQLLVCRLVCKTWCWNTNLKTLIRANSVVNLRAVFLHTSATASNLQEYFQKSGTIYSYYNFEDISFQNVFISNFFQVIGPTITSLKLLLNLQQLNRRQFRELIYERVPNLKELNIYNLSHKEIYSKPLAKSKDVGVGAPYNLRHDNLAKLQLQETRTLIIPFMTEFLRTLPKLKEISLKVGICRDWVEQADLWRENSSIATSVIKALEVSKAFQTLKVFRCGKLRRIHIECLLGMASGENGLRLEVLQVHVPHKDSEDIFTTFLNTQRNCLIELSLFEQRSSRHKRKPTGTTGQPQYFVLKFPNIMTKLEVLQLSKHYKSVIVPLAPIDFSIQCPKLKKLVLLGQYADANSHLRINETNTSVCDIVMWNRVIHASSALELGSFINLKKLHIRYPTSEFLANLWQSCDKIQNLTLILEEGTYVDEGIAGIPETVIAEWVSQAMETGSPLLEIVTKNFKEEDKCVDNASDNNSITNLKDLRVLKITVEHCEQCQRQSLCDVMAYAALRKLKSLRLLELFTSDWDVGITECAFFSKECQDLLRKELDLCVIHFEPLQTSD